MSTNNETSAPVDVLAVMADDAFYAEQARRPLQGFERAQRARTQSEEARAAVAELCAERDRLANIVRDHEAQIRRMTAERAELILAAKALADRVEFEGDEHRYDYQYLPLRAALAKFGGSA